MINENEVFYSSSPKDDILCKNCKYKIGKTNFSNNYHKAYCGKYEYPNRKPYDILIEKERKCMYYQKDELQDTPD